MEALEQVCALSNMVQGRMPLELIVILKLGTDHTDPDMAHLCKEDS